ncbi:MAG: formylglycine-generating enzyme family protein [Candidatus Sumerlaeota bacterium]|nr:formylglycine-generating enzyme family protein [Candidatus Sumerlaeota bacterium]
MKKTPGIVSIVTATTTLSVVGAMMFVITACDRSEPQPVFSAPEQGYLYDIDSGTSKAITFRRTADGAVLPEGYDNADKGIASSTKTASGLNEERSYIENLGDSVTMKMIWIKGGKFQMGSNDGRDEERPVHEVKLDGFWMGETEITQAQWKAIMGTTMREQQDKTGMSWAEVAEGDDYPMLYVDWGEAYNFCKKIHTKTGREYSVPSESQWEYACRAGSADSFCFGNSDWELQAYAWYNVNSHLHVHPVKTKRPNQWGLYDMHGNVCEWVVANTYPGREPLRLVSKGQASVYRGGSWNDSADCCRSAYRFKADYALRCGSLGFRVSRSPE